MSQLPEEDLYSRISRYASLQGDGTIYAYLQEGRRNAERLENTMEKIIYALHTEKEQYKQMAIDAQSRSTYNERVKND